MLYMSAEKYLIWDSLFSITCRLIHRYAGFRESIFFSVNSKLNEMHEIKNIFFCLYVISRELITK